MKPATDIVSGMASDAADLIGDLVGVIALPNSVRFSTERGVFRAVVTSHPERCQSFASVAPCRMANAQRQIALSTLVFTKLKPRGLAIIMGRAAITHEICE
jgi:hypothetical protein